MEIVDTVVDAVVLAVGAGCTFRRSFKATVFD
jgi:hypothetical protein